MDIRLYLVTIVVIGIVADMGCCIICQMFTFTPLYLWTKFIVISLWPIIYSTRARNAGATIRTVAGTVQSEQL